jgi:sugar phosphate isomerase/epimerase
VAEPDPGPEFVAGFFTLTGAGFGEPPRHGFPARCEAAAAAGFTGIGLHVSAGEFRGGELDPVAAAKRLAEAAGRAAEGDLLVAVESFPWSAIRDHATAVDLVRRSGAPDAGLLVDVWHFFNARATRRLPGEGELDVVGLVQAVERAGFTGPYCVEVNTPEFRALPLAEAAERAFTTSAEIVRKARST